MYDLSIQVPDVTMVGGSVAGSHGVEEVRVVTKATGAVEEPAPAVACLAMETKGVLQVDLGGQASLPRAWSNPQLSSHIRPGLEPPLVHTATVTDAVYELDVARGICVKTSREGSPLTPERRQSMPDIGSVCSLVLHSTVLTFFICLLDKISVELYIFVPDK